MSWTEIVELKRSGINDIRPIFARCHASPYRFLRREIPSQLSELWFEKFRSERQLFAAYSDGLLVGLSAISDLPWDSRVFGRGMGAIGAILIDPAAPKGSVACEGLIRACVEWARDNALEFVLCRAFCDDSTIIHGLERAGFLLVDTLLEYVFDGRKTSLESIARPEARPELILRSADAADLGGLLELANVSFSTHFGRYHADSRFSRDQATRVYEEWVRSSLAGYADWIIVAEIGGRIAGCSIWKRPSPVEKGMPVRVGHYSIAATHPDFAGLGLFQTLTYAGMELLIGEVDCIEGPTHVNNYPVQRGYSKLGWRIADARHSFHYWIE